MRTFVRGTQRALTVAALLCLWVGVASAQKYGGVLKAVHRENPPSLLFHEWATMSTSWPDEVDRRLQTDVARAMLGQALDFVMFAPWVKGYVPHNSIYSYGRMQNVWLDK